MSGQLVADIYIRESKDELARAYSPEEMIRQCREKAAELGAVVGRAVVEVAKRDEIDCPELIEEIRRAQSGEIDYLISYDMIRLSGDIGKHLGIKDQFARTAARIVYVEAEYAETPEGDFQEMIQGAVGRYERMKTRARTQNGIRGKLKEGRPIGNGVAPYGLEKVRDERGRPIGYAPAEPQIGVLRGIVRDLATMTLEAVCGRLNDAGVPTPSGAGRWQGATILSLLGNEHYRGVYTFGVTRQIPGRSSDGKRTYRKERNDPARVTTLAVDPVIDLGDFERARAALAGRRSERRSRRPEGDDPFTLRGRVRCEHCGGVLSCTVNNGYRRYTCLRSYPTKAQRGAPDFERCTGPLPQIHADDLEAHVLAYVERVLSDPDTAERELRLAAQGDDAVRRYAAQVDLLKLEIGRLERKIRAAVTIMLDAEDDATSYEHARAARQQAERAKRELAASLEALAGQRPSALEGDDLEAAVAAVREVAAGLAAARGSAEGLRLAYAALDVRGTVGLDGGGDGERLGRDHRYRVSWRLRRALSDGDKYAHGYLLLWDSSQDAPPTLALATSGRR